MAVPSTPTNFVAQTADTRNLLTWDVSATATSYTLEVSPDNQAFSVLQTGITFPEYEDTAVSVGTRYYYRVIAINGDGPSAPTDSELLIPAPVSEMSLYQLRNVSKQKADRVHSEFVTDSEWNAMINRACYELYDLLITVYEDYYYAPPLSMTLNGGIASVDLPNGSNYNGAPALYKLMGVDLGVANSSQDAFVTLTKFNFVDRNKYLYPNSASTIYGVFNLQYRQMGDKLLFIPTPSGGQTIKVHYAPKLPQLLKDTDVTNLGYSGWLEYVICRAAKYALDKEESDTSAITQELVFLKQRIEESASNRDSGRGDTISDVRGNIFGGNGGNGSSFGPIGGW